MSRPAGAGHPEQSRVPSLHAPTGGACMQERRANLHRLPSRDCGEDTAESSSVPHGKASLCWDARLARCRDTLRGCTHPVSTKHQYFCKPPKSPRSRGHPGSTDITLKGLDARGKGWAAFPSLNPPRAALHWQDRASPAASAHFCSWRWFVARDTQVVHGLAVETGVLGCKARLVLQRVEMH